MFAEIHHTSPQLILLGVIAIIVSGVLIFGAIIWFEQDEAE